VKVAAAAYHTLALKEDGTVVQWGQTRIDFPFDVPEGLSGVTDVALGKGHAIALKADGAVAMWCDEDNGLCNVPAGVSNVTAVAAGPFHTVALVREPIKARIGLLFMILGPAE
jgi:alpha-tubulin suppressor-like RCC1 family protein